MKIRDEGLVRNKAVYLAVGVSCAGRKEVLGLWIEQTEGAKFWLSVMNELKARGVADVLKGFPKAIEAVYPEARGVRNSVYGAPLWGLFGPVGWLTL